MDYSKAFLKLSWTFLIFVRLFFIYTCNNSSTSEATFDQLCRFEGICLNCSDGGCGDMCNFYDNNCCVNSSSKTTSLMKWQYSCVRTFPDMYDLHLDCRASKNGVYGVYMVTKCSDRWRDDSIKSKCENSSEADLLSRIPVYNNVHEELIYANMYCAFCNWASLKHIRFWKFDLLCESVIGGNEGDLDPAYVPDACFIRLVYRQHRMCAVDVIETCTQNSSVRNHCENGLLQTVFAWKYGQVFSAYKNEFCAQCNGETDELQCWAFQAFSCWPQDLPPYNSVQAMISLDLKARSSTDSIELYNKACGERVLYDPFHKTCLNITCLPFQNMCISGKCHLIKLEISETSHQNDSSLYVLALDVFISVGRYFVEAPNVHVCLNDTQYSEFQSLRPSTTPSKIKTTTNRSTELTFTPDTTSASFPTGSTCKSSDTLLRLFVLFVVFCTFYFNI